MAISTKIRDQLHRQKLEEEARRQWEQLQQTGTVNMPKSGKPGSLTTAEINRLREEMDRQGQPPSAFQQQMQQSMRQHMHEAQARAMAKELDDEIMQRMRNHYNGGGVLSEVDVSAVHVRTKTTLSIRESEILAIMVEHIEDVDKAVNCMQVYLEGKNTHLREHWDREWTRSKQVFDAAAMKRGRIMNVYGTNFISHPGPAVTSLQPKRRGQKPEPEPKSAGDAATRSLRSKMSKLNPFKRS